MRQLQLGNAANWAIIYNENVSAVFLAKEGGGYKAVPIPEIEIPVLLDSFVLAVKVVTVVPEGRTWRFAGNIRQTVSTGISAFESQDASFTSRRPLFLGKINLVLFPKISISYGISIKVPDWFENASVAIWQYTGTDYDADLVRIEEKLDGLIELVGH